MWKSSPSCLAASCKERADWRHFLTKLGWTCLTNGGYEHATPHPSQGCLAATLVFCPLMWLALEPPNNSQGPALYLLLTP
jgi:hypothetical protein